MIIAREQKVASTAQNLVFIGWFQLTGYLFSLFLCGEFHELVAKAINTECIVMEEVIMHHLFHNGIKLLSGGELGKFPALAMPAESEVYLLAIGNASDDKYLIVALFVCLTVDDVVDFST